MESVNFLSLVLTPELSYLVFILCKRGLDIVLLNIEISWSLILHNMIVLQLQDHVVAGYWKLLPVLNLVHLQRLFVKGCPLRGLTTRWVYSGVIDRVAASFIRIFHSYLARGNQIGATYWVWFIFFATQTIIDVQVE